MKNGLVYEPNKLTPREQELYDLLVEHKGEVVSRKRINMFLGLAEKSRDADVYTGYLRKKGVKVTTVRGFGYSIKN